MISELHLRHDDRDVVWLSSAALVAVGSSALGKGRHVVAQVAELFGLLCQHLSNQRYVLYHAVLVLICPFYIWPDHIYYRCPVQIVPESVAAKNYDITLFNIVGHRLALHRVVAIRPALVRKIEAMLLFFRLVTNEKFLARLPRVSSVRRFATEDHVTRVAQITGLEHLCLLVKH